MRVAELERKTSETVVRVRLNLDGSGRMSIDTGVNFLNHLLGALTKHGLFDLEVEARSLTAPDEHHVVEDTAITLGQALAKTLGDKKGIRRFGYAMVPMDEALAEVAVDLSGRSYLVFQGSFKGMRIGDLETGLVTHFLRSLTQNGRFTLHVASLYGEDDHHKAEALFKALAVALSQAIAPEPRLKDAVLSQKGVLE